MLLKIERCKETSIFWVNVKYLTKKMLLRNTNYLGFGT